MKKTVFIVILIGVYSQIFSQNMDDYEKNYYCMVGYTHPQRVVESNNNWELLNKLIGGKTLSELNAKEIKYPKKHLDILQMLNLVEERGDKYYPKVCIFNEEKTKKIREETYNYALKIISEINKDYKTLKKILLNQGFEGNTYTIFFSYVMDDLVWDELEKLNYKTIRELTPDNPFWSGNVWFIYPKRNFSCGTNKMSHDGYTANVNWSYDSGVSFNKYKNLSLMIDEYKLNRKITNKSNKDILMNYGLCKTDGSVNFPIIKNDENDDINNISNKIAKTITDFLIKEIDFSSIMSQYNINSKTETVVILYHEIMWDILDILEKDNKIKKPKAFLEPDNCKKTDFKDLFFLIEM